MIGLALKARINNILYNTAWRVRNYIPSLAAIGLISGVAVLDLDNSRLCVMPLKEQKHYLII